MNKKQKLLIVLTISFCLFYMVYVFTFGKEEKVDAKEPIIEEKEEKEERIIEKYKVDIKGQIVKPGVYEVEQDSRVIDVIKLAGGLKKDANTDFLNLSKKVEDGTVIWVYTKKEIEQLKKTKTVIEYIEKECHCPDVSNSACINKEDSNSKVNINTATLEELTKLTGIGEAKAKLIIEYRTNKPFKKIEDIMNVSGIGESAYEKIKNLITV